MNATRLSLLKNVAPTIRNRIDIRTYSTTRISLINNTTRSTKEYIDLFRNNKNRTRTYATSSQTEPIIVQTQNFPVSPLPIQSNTLATTTNSTNATAVAPSFYKRPLPGHLIPFSSPQGKTLFKEAIAGGGMESYWTLAEQFHTQSEPAYCGLATLTMVLNALQIDPNRLWKGPWRWFSEDLLDCCTPLEIVKKEGITFSDFACLAKCNGADIEAFRAEQSNEAEFRSQIKEACSKEGNYIVVSFSRAILGQTGDGHFSAISGYHEEKDLVLVMDTAKFKYPAFWCPVSLLYEAMKPKDGVTGLSRGYYSLKKSTLATGSCGSLACSSQAKNAASIAGLSEESVSSWTVLSHYISHKLPIILRDVKPQSVEDVISSTLKYLPKDIDKIISLDEDSYNKPNVNPSTKNIEQLMKEIQHTKLFPYAKGVVSDSQLTPEMVTLLLISSPSPLYKGLSSELRSQLKELRDIDSLPLELSKEVIQMRYKMLNFAKQCSCRA